MYIRLPEVVSQLTDALLLFFLNILFSLCVSVLIYSITVSLLILSSVLSNWALILSCVFFILHIEVFSLYKFIMGLGCIFHDSAELLNIWNKIMMIVLMFFSVNSNTCACMELILIVISLYIPAPLHALNFY